MDYPNFILDAPKRVSSTVLTPEKYIIVRLGGNGLIINNLSTTVSTWTKTTVSGGYLYTKSFDVSKYGKILELGSYYITNSRGLILSNVTASISSDKTKIEMKVFSSSSISSSTLWYVNVNAVYTDVPMLVKSNAGALDDLSNYLTIHIDVSGDEVSISIYSNYSKVINFDLSIWISSSDGNDDEGSLSASIQPNTWYQNKFHTSDGYNVSSAGIDIVFTADGAAPYNYTWEY